MTVREFCDLHDACQDGRDWAIATGQTLQEIWQRDDLDPYWRVWMATCPGVLDDKTRQLFARWCDTDWNTAYDDAYDEVRDKTWAAAVTVAVRVASRAAANWLRENTNPNWEAMP